MDWYSLHPFVTQHCLNLRELFLPYECFEVCPVWSTFVCKGGAIVSYMFRTSSHFIFFLPVHSHRQNGQSSQLVPCSCTRSCILLTSLDDESGSPFGGPSGDRIPWAFCQEFDMIFTSFKVSIGFYRGFHEMSGPGPSQLTIL